MESYMIIAITTGLFFSLRHIVNKYVIENHMSGIAWYYYYTVISVVSFPIISWLISPMIFPSMQSWFYIISSSIVSFIAVLILIYALTIGDVTTAGPVISSKPIFIVPLSFIFLGEFYGYAIIGWILLIVFGAIMTSWNQGMKFKHVLSNRVLGLFFITTVLMAMVSIFSKPALQELDHFNYMGWWHIVQIPLLLAFMPFVMNKNEKINFRKRWKSTLPYAILENVFLYGSMITLFFALKYSVTLTEALFTTQGVFTVVIGSIISRINPNFLAEKHTKQIYIVRLLGAIIILIGVYQILL